MSDTLTPLPADAASTEATAGPVRDRPVLRRVLLAVIGVAVLVIAVGVGVFWGTRTAPSVLPSSSSVDAGFARDMSTHHQQAITMATYTESATSDKDVAALAYDIESSQTIQMGTMVGWLQAWGDARDAGTPMSWMGSSDTMAHMSMANTSDDALLMPGMATPAQMTTLQTLHGRALDVMFLQLMIRHHQGGLSMERYAAQHAQESFVRDFAGHLVATQSSEITQMTQMLTALGGTPLPKPVG